MRKRNFIDKVMDFGYELADKMRGGLRQMAVSRSQRNELNKVSSWYKSFKKENLQLPHVEGIKFTKSGAISAKSDFTAVETMGEKLGGTAKQWIKKHPAEYEARMKQIAEYRANVKRIMAAVAKRRGVDEAFDEFKNWYEGGDHKSLVGILAERDSVFKGVISGFGSLYRNKELTTEQLKTIRDDIYSDFDDAFPGR